MLFEDFEGLLNNTMMTAALLLSFSVTLHTGSKSLDDFSEADERRFRLFVAGGKLDIMQTSDIASYQVNLYGCQKQFHTSPWCSSLGVLLRFRCIYPQQEMTLISLNFCLTLTSWCLAYASC